MKPGFVYLIRAENGLIKIGRSADPAERLLQFSSLPVAVELIHQIATNDMAWLEAELHAEYASQRVRGEWFSLSPADVKALAHMKTRDRDTSSEAEGAKDFHKKRVVQVHAPLELSEALNRLTDMTRRTRPVELVLALERHLEAEGLWPPPPPQTDSGEGEG
jgi:hypothetical protein